MCVHLYGFPLSQGICDGAGAVVLASEDALKKFNLKPLARVAGYSVSGVDPSIMGIGPVSAIRKLLDKTSMKLEDIDLVEVSLCKFRSLSFNLTCKLTTLRISTLQTVSLALVCFSTCLHVLFGECVNEKQYQLDTRPACSV